MHNHERTAEEMIKKLQPLSMRPDVSSRIRADLAAYADFHTLGADTRIAVIPERKRAGIFGEMSRWYAPIAGALVIALMTGTTYAAEKSLPGDTLYTIKVRVTEPVQLALSTTAEGKAKTHTALAERRLQEAETLAVEKKLDSGTQVYLTQEFSRHVDNSLAAADELKVSGNIVAALDAKSSLEASLAAHEDILDEVEEHLEEAGADALAVHASARELKAAVEVRQEVVRETRLAMERELEAGTNPTETLAVITKADTAVPKAAAAAQAKAVVPEPVVRRVADAEQALVEAKESIESSDPEDTRRAYRKAREAALESEIATVLVKNTAVLTAVAKVDIGTTTMATTTQATTTATSTPAQ